MPAGMFAASHTQAMVEMSDDKDIGKLFGLLRIIKTTGPFAGHAVEARVHLMMERGATDPVDFRFLTRNSGVLNSLDTWAGEQSEGRHFYRFHRADKLDEGAKMAKNSYWKATMHNFPSIDGVAVRESEERFCVRFIQIIMNKQEKSRKKMQERLAKLYGSDHRGVER